MYNVIFISSQIYREFNRLSSGKGFRIHLLTKSKAASGNFTKASDARYGNFLKYYHYTEPHLAIIFTVDVGVALPTNWSCSRSIADKLNLTVKAKIPYSRKKDFSFRDFTPRSPHKICTPVAFPTSYVEIVQNELHICSFCFNLIDSTWLIHFFYFQIF